MRVEPTLLSEGSLEPRSHQVGWVVHRRLLGNGAFDSGFEIRKSPPWVEWGEGIPRQGRGCGNCSTSGESRGKSAPELEWLCQESRAPGPQDKGQGREGKEVPGCLQPHGRKGKDPHQPEVRKWSQCCAAPD